MFAEELVRADVGSSPVCKFRRATEMPTKWTGVFRRDSVGRRCYFIYSVCCFHATNLQCKLTFWVFKNVDFLKGGYPLNERSP